MPAYEFSTEELQQEEWRSVIGWFAGLYSISSLGRVRRDIASQGTQVGRILKYQIGTDGYRYVTLSLGAGERRYSVQRLVTLAFFGPKPQGHNINHIDGVKTNNRTSNLEYVTFSRNSKHAFEIGLSPRGENHGISKLTNQQVRDIKQRLTDAPKGTRSKLARIYGVNYSVIAKIDRGEIWTHIKI